jgi:hypothetical protein
MRKSAAVSTVEPELDSLAEAEKKLSALTAVAARERDRVADDEQKLAELRRRRDSASIRTREGDEEARRELVLTENSIATKAEEITMGKRLVADAQADVAAVALVVQGLRAQRDKEELAHRAARLVSESRSRVAEFSTLADAIEKLMPTLDDIQERRRALHAKGVNFGAFSVIEERRRITLRIGRSLGYVI